MTAANNLIYNRNREVLYDMQRTPDISPKAILEEHIQGVRTPVQKKPFYFGRERRAELSAASKEATQHPKEKSTLQRGKDTQSID